MHFPNATRRAEFGARLLDRKLPGWHQRINTATLDIRSDCQCVLAQLHNNSWLSALDALQLDFTTLVFGGFIEGPQPGVRDAWVHEITRRRMADHERDIAATAKESVNA